MSWVGDAPVLAIFYVTQSRETERALGAGEPLAAVCRAFGQNLAHGHHERQRQRWIAVGQLGKAQARQTPEPAAGGGLCLRHRRQHRPHGRGLGGRPWKP